MHEVRLVEVPRVRTAEFIRKVPRQEVQEASKQIPKFGIRVPQLDSRG